MKKNCWIARLGFKLMASTARASRRSFSDEAIVEQLERRQMLTTVATPIGVNALVNTTTTGDQITPAVAMDSQGDYVVTWQSADSSGWGIFAQRYNPYGVAQGSEFQVNSQTTGDQTGPAIAMDATGDFVVTWSSSDGNGLGVWARRFNASGVAQGSDFLVNTFTTNDQTHGSVAMDAAGDFVIAWQSTNQTNNSYFSSAAAIYAQRYNSAGTRVGSEFEVNTHTTGSYTAPSVAMNAAGQFVVAWVATDYDNFVDPFSHISAKRYDANGNVSADIDEFGFGYHGQHNPEVAIDANGNFAATFWGYEEDVIDGPGDTGVRAAISTQSGINFAVNTYQTGNQRLPSISVGGNGDFVIAWQSDNQDGSGSGVYKQEYDSSFNAVGVETRVNTVTTGGQSVPAVASDTNGDYVIVWQSDGQDGSGAGIYSQQYFASASTQNPMLLQLEGKPIDAIAPLNTPITSALNVYDAVNNNWTGATISISNNYQNGQDVLSFTSTATITGTWSAATGVLTLSGTDSLSNYRAAIRSITYHNTSGTPNTALTRTISIQAKAGATLSNTVTRALNVRATSAAPTVTGLPVSSTYVSPTVPLVIAPNLVVTEPDGLMIQSATVTFTNWQGEDRVAFLNTLALQHTFTQDLVNHTATLTITGPATAAGYQTLLRSVTYQDVAGNPITNISRVATFNVSDQLHSGAGTTSLSVSLYLSGVAASTTFYKGSPPLVIAPNLVIAPPTGLSIQSATVTFTNWQGEDRVDFSNTLALQHAFTQDLVAHTATLTITGTASAAGYQTLLRSVTYQDVAGAPVQTPRVATIKVNDGTNSPSISENIAVVVSKPPVVQVNDSSSLSYKINTTAIPIMSQALVSDPDSDNLQSMTIQITSGFQTGHDVLSFVNQLGITGSYNTTNGTLTLTGSSYVGNYRTALRAVMFNSINNTVGAASRTFTVIATDASGVSSAPVTRNITVTT